MTKGRYFCNLTTVIILANIVSKLDEYLFKQNQTSKKVKTTYICNQINKYLTMETRTLNQLFEIDVIELNEWSQRPYQNNFFEIVYIDNGSGSQCIAGVDFTYSADNIFLLPPLNCHSFNITEPSRFIFIKFLDNFFLHGGVGVDYKGWFERVSYILANYNRIPGDIITSESDRKYIVNAIQAIVSEHLARDGYSNAIVSGLMISVLNLIARNIERKFVHNMTPTDSRFNTLLRYINSHLMDGEQLKIPALANHFGISKSYFSEYFSKNAGVKLSEYILKAKLKLAETYILHTDNSLKEIAHSLGFTDSSHLSNSFKKHYDITIGQFRENSASLCRK